MKIPAVLRLALSASACSAFSPASSTGRTAYLTASPAPATTSARSAPSPLEVVPDEPTDFDTYSISDVNQELAVKDTVVGTGDEARIGDVVTVAYTGRLMSTGKQFDTGAGYTFKIGERRVMPGWE